MLTGNALGFRNQGLWVRLPPPVPNRGVLRFSFTGKNLTSYGPNIWDELPPCTRDERDRYPLGPPNQCSLAKRSNASGFDPDIRRFESYRSIQIHWAHEIIYLILTTSSSLISGLSRGKILSGWSLLLA